MAEGRRSKVQHMVADSAAFLKNAPLHEMCENVYTVEEVVSEIRDAATRQRLAVLPYTLDFRQPSIEALHAGKLCYFCSVLIGGWYFEDFDVKALIVMAKYKFEPKGTTGTEAVD